MAICLNDRALVTGAASGFGLALTRGLSERGCRVLAVDLTDETPRTLRGLSGMRYRRLDVRSDVDWAAAREQVMADWNGLDLLVNNAGVGSGGDIDVEPISEWERVVSINLLGVVRGCQVFAPVFKDQHTGHIVNVASAAGLVHPPGMASYNAVKAGVVALSETLHIELEPFGIATSVVCPSFFRTDIARNMAAGDAKDMASALIDASPRTAEELAATVLTAVDAGTHLILPDKPTRAAYLVKRFARPVYLRSLRAMAARSRARRAGAAAR